MKLAWLLGEELDGETMRLEDRFEKIIGCNDYRRGKHKQCAVEQDSQMDI